ncbi:hypothetical protein FEQ02_06625 [Burkholderia pseudomultivorans]|nr:hypothetical protein [Burkholderia pseudomultivorans]
MRVTICGSTYSPPFAMVAYDATISFSVTGLVPSASDGTRSSGLSRTPMSRASRATAAGPTFSITCAVIRLRDSATASRSVIGLPVGGTSSFGRQISPPFSGISTGWSMKVSSGFMPPANAAP